MKKYVGMYQELGFDEEFLKQAKEQLKRMGKEIPFRKEEETLRKLEEERLAKKNKKKGKKK